MLSYVVRRGLIMIPTLFLVSILVFMVITLPPGDYLTLLRNQLEQEGDSASMHQLRSLERRYALDRPVYVQYFVWLRGMLRFDFGESFEWNSPVTTVVGERLFMTLIVSITTLIFTWGIAIPIGIYSATHQYSLGDYVVSFIGFLGLSTPNFLLALVLMFVAVFYFDVSSIGGLFSREFINAPWSWARVADLISHLWIPIIVIGTAGTAGLVRIMRGNLLDVLGAQYIQTARVKGLKERLVIYRHAVRVAINPLISIFGMSFPQILSGEAIAAIVLGLPTLGPLLLRALQSRDTYLAASILLFYAVALLIGNLVADIMLGWSDPRIRYD